MGGMTVSTPVPTPDSFELYTKLFSTVLVTVRFSVLPSTERGRAPNVLFKDSP